MNGTPQPPGQLPPEGDVPAEKAWSRLPERGSLMWLRIIAAIYRTLGRTVCLGLLYPIAAYFTVFARTARKSSHQYLETLWNTPQGKEILGTRPGRFAPFRHIHAFSINLFDRMVAWGDGLNDIQFDHQGSEHLFEAARKGGAILVGAHLGSFDLMRLLANDHGLTLNVLMFTRHAARINLFFESIDPESRIRVLELDPDSVASTFAIKACLERGELVGVLADRMPPGGREVGEPAMFLGRPVTLPRSVFELAAVLGCPLIFTACVRLDHQRYEVVARPMGEGRVPRRRRAEYVHGLVQTYVNHLESYCFRTPYQWFNFYDYWGTAPVDNADG